MPRPRSSTFYLPLAPIDAPLELKAKLSVLPPSAANALLAPRNHYNPQLSNGGLPHNNHGGGGCGFGFSRSTATATMTTNNAPCSINHVNQGYAINTSSGVPLEDECTRLNRVLGIPTHQTPHTHIPLPESPNAHSSTFTSNLNVPSSAGRRRHTDAPKPSFPISRGPTRSPLLPTPVPSENTGTGYFSTWGNSDWKQPAPGPSVSTSTSTLILQLPTPALSIALSERVAPSPPGLSTPPGLGLPSISESETDSMSDTVSDETASIPADNQNGPSSSAFQRPHSTLTVPVPAPVPVPVSDNDRVSGEDGNVRVGGPPREDGSGNGETCETEVLNGMVWTSGADAEEWNTGVPISSGSKMGPAGVVGVAVSTMGPGVHVGQGAFDMHVFAGACEVQNPAVVQREVDAPSASSSNGLRRTPSPLPSTIAIASPPPGTTTTLSLPTISTTRTTPAAAPTSAKVRPTPAPTRAPLSYIPCGMHHVLACRTKVRSRFAPSPPPLPRSRGSSRPCTAVHASRPSTSSSSSMTSTTSMSTTTPSTATSSSSIVLTSKLAIRPPPCDSLHPNDTRHLLRPQFRLSFPPPPAPLPVAKDTHPREEACMFVDESIPGLVDINASFVSTSHDDDPSASQEPSYTSQQPAAKLAPRQRFRLAPSYLPKVLRRSLGPTAWVRAETLRAARAIECGFGWGAPGMMMNGAVCSNLNGAVPLDFHTGAGAWPLAFAGLDGMRLGPQRESSGSAWWQSANGAGGGTDAQPGCDFSSSLVWSGYEDAYSEEADEDMEMVDGDEVKEESSIWDWEDEDVEPVMVHGQGRQQAMDEDGDEFVREGAPEPEERPSPSDYSPQSSPSYSIQTPSTPSDPEVAGYSMVGKFGWDTTWPASPTSAMAPPAAGGETTHFQSIDIPGLDVTPIILGLPPVHRRSVRREDGAEEEDDEEEIFRYSPLKVEEEEEGIHGRMYVEGDDEEGVQVDYLHTQTMSSCSTPTATSPSFPPGPLRGVAISSSFDDGYLVDRAEQAEDNQEFYDADGDAEMEEAPTRNVLMSRPPIRAPRPLSLVQHPVLHHQYREDACSPPPNSVFIIPPSPLTTTTFDVGSGTGSSTPTSATAAPMFPDRMEEEGDLSNVGWPTATSVEHALSPKRSYERIVAPRPQRVSRALEQVFPASTSSPVYRTSSLAQSPPLPRSPPSSSSSPRIPSASSPRWTFGSLKSALSNSMSHLVELARSRSPSPLPWLMRGSAGYTGATLSGVAAALDSHRQSGSEEELESERSTSCVTPTPAAESHSRRSSTTTITGASTSRRAELKLQVDPTSADAMMSESPPPKRTLSTSSLSSLGSEPDSESGSSGGIFSRSPSPEPGSDTRIWDPSYTLTPRSRPISADAKAAAACGGRLSPMMIPGSWDPAELWAEEGDLAKTW